VTSNCMQLFATWPDQYIWCMAKVLALDIGTKRTGIAETDPLQLIATGLSTIETTQLLPFLKSYVIEEKPELLVIGEPKRLHGAPSHVEAFIVQQMQHIQKAFPALPIRRVDERFTSKIAGKSLVQSGLKKKHRQNKALIDEVSAVLILQSWLDSRH
jgi:putative Holliday junction resolvase